MNYVEYDEYYNVSTFVITKDNECIYYPEYNPNLDSSIIFIMLTNNVLNPDYGFDNTICIYISSWDFNLYPIRVFQKEQVHIPNAKQYDFELDFSLVLIEASKDMDGYNNTINIITQASHLLKRYNQKQRPKLKTLDEYIPVIMHVHKMRVEFNNKTYHAYLPSLGQIEIIKTNHVVINEIVSQFSEYVSLIYNDNRLWSSSEYDETAMWVSDERMEPGGFYKDKIYDPSMVLPLFNLNENKQLSIL